MIPHPDSHELDHWQLSRVKTNSEKNRYRPTGRKPVRSTDFVNDPDVIARQKRALVRMHAAE
jgi:hypothetical protein